MESRTSVLFCIDSMNGGGAEKLLLRYMKILKSSGRYDITLCVIQGFGVLMASLPSDVEVIFLENLSSDEFNSFNSTYFDIEIGFLEGLAIKYITMRPTECVKLGWIHTDMFYNNWCPHYYSDWSQLDSYNCLSQIICINEFCKSQFCHAFPLLADKVDVCNNILDFYHLDTARKHKKTRTDCLFRLCFVGRLTLEKHPEIAVMAVAELRERNYNVTLDLIGEGYLFDDLKMLIVRYGLEDFIRLHGYLTNPYPVIADSDLLLSLSEREGGPLVIPEAYYLGIPSIATHSGGADAFNDEYGGVVMIENSIHELVDIIVRYIDNVNKFRDKLLSQLQPYRILQDFSEKQLLNLVEHWSMKEHI